MKTLFGRIVLIVAGMVLFAASAAIASDQIVEVAVHPHDELSISVLHNLWFGAAEVNEASEMQYFDIQIVNTAGSAWEVTATSTDLAGYDEINCDEFGCEEIPNGKTIAASALHLWGADGTGWEGEQADDVIPYDGVLDTTAPLLIMKGIGEMYGSFGFLNPAHMQLTVPNDDTLPGAYRATVTYTIGVQAP